jgi:proteasome lid subunit RPN8/RPN11
VDGILKTDDGCMKLRIRPLDLRAIDIHALESFPLECCGLFFGRYSGGTIEVKEVMKARNRLGSAVAFEADPEFVFRAIDRGNKMGLELVGIYHSHPNIAAYVSARDLEIMKLWEGTAWLILSVKDGLILERKAYTFRNGKVEDLELIIS